MAIRDSERQGKAQVEMVTDGEEPAEMIQVEGMCGVWEPSWELLKGSDQPGAWCLETDGHGRAGASNYSGL